MNGFRWMVVTAATVALVACGGGKYSEVEQLLSDEIDIMETFVEEMEAADSAGAVADALNGYNEGMSELIPRLEKLAESYPEIQTRQDLPPELEKKLATVDELGGRMQGAVMKTMRYMQSPEVQKAMENFGKNMSRQRA